MQSQKLVRNQSEDPSLVVCRDFAENNMRGYQFKDRILFHCVLGNEDEECCRIVLPKYERQRVLKMAHDYCGHLSGKEVRAIANRKFTWPGLGGDIV